MMYNSFTKDLNDSDESVSFYQIQLFELLVQINKNYH